MPSKILVVEDELDLRENINDILTARGYDVLTAWDGVEAMDKIKTKTPDLILSDIIMPNMDGYTLLGNLQKDPGLATIPFIFLTAKFDHSSVRKGMISGADDYLVKPFHIKDLIGSIEARIRKAEQIRQLTYSVHEEINSKIRHEMRTPLVPILGYSELIEDENDFDEVKKMVRAINGSGKSLHRIIEKFLLYEEVISRNKMENNLKVESNSFGFSESTIIECIKDIASIYNNILKRIEADVEPAVVSINEFYFKYIVTELVENAAKFSPENSSIFISGHNTKDHYKFSVTDSGRGMEKEEIEAIGKFKKFGFNKATETGVGLGLAAITNIVNLYDGEMRIVSERNQYTTVEITFNKNREN